MTAYLDSSVVLRHILNGDISIHHVFEQKTVISSVLLEIECRRVLHRSRLQGLLDDASLLLALERLQNVLQGVTLLKIHDDITLRAMEPFPLVVKTLDAIHLASAQEWLRRNPDSSISIYSFDSAMNRVAKSIGFLTPFLT